MTGALPPSQGPEYPPGLQRLPEPPPGLSPQDKSHKTSGSTGVQASPNAGNVSEAAKRVLLPVPPGLYPPGLDPADHPMAMKLPSEASSVPHQLLSESLGHSDSHSSLGLSDESSISASESAESQAAATTPAAELEWSLKTYQASRNVVSEMFESEAAHIATLEVLVNPTVAGEKSPLAQLADLATSSADKQVIAHFEDSLKSHLTEAKQLIARLDGARSSFNISEEGSQDKGSLDSAVTTGMGTVHQSYAEIGRYADSLTPLMISHGDFSKAVGRIKRGENKAAFEALNDRVDKPDVPPFQIRDQMKPNRGNFDSRAILAVQRLPRHKDLILSLAKRAPADSEEHRMLTQLGTEVDKKVMEADKKADLIAADIAVTARRLAGTSERRTRNIYNDLLNSKNPATIARRLDEAGALLTDVKALLAYHSLHWAKQNDDEWRGDTGRTEAEWKQLQGKLEMAVSYASKKFQDKLPR